MSQQNSLDLETRLIERTMAQRDEMLEKAETEAKLLLDNGEKEAQRIKSETDRQILNIVASVLRGVRDRIIGGIELDSRKRLMITREEVFQQIYIEAEKKLKEITEDKKTYHETLVKLISEAVTSIGGAEFIVSTNDRDLIDLKKNQKKFESDIQKLTGVKMTLQLDETPISTIGGVVVKDVSGKKTFFNTLEGRTQKAQAKLNIQLAKVLEAQ
jgi:vacuolar-type H+-ATPase subunit E/Vma4